MDYKFYKGKRYRLLRSRWVRGHLNIPLAHDVWNEYHSNDSIKENEVIHHKNRNTLDDRIKNLEKLTKSEHASLHGREGDRDYRCGIARKENLKKWHQNYRKTNYKYKQLFAFAPESYVQYYDKICINLNTDYITVTHGWKYYKKE